MEQFKDWISKITKTLQDHPKGMTVTEISRSLNISRNSISKYLDIMRISGQIDMKRFGPAKVFYLSQRVPISALLNFSSDSIMVLDEDLRIIQINDNLLKLFNLKFDLVIDVNLENANIPLLSDREMLKKVRKARNSEGDVIDVDFKLGETTLFFKMKLIPTTLGDGESGLTIILEDITYAKNFERSLRDNEEKYRALYDNSRDAIILRDGGRFFECNDTALNMFRCRDIDYLREHFMGMAPDTQPDGRSSEEYLVENQKRLEEIGFIRFDGVFRRKDGTDFHAEVIINRLLLGDRPIDHIVIRDITERKEAENFRIRHSQALGMSSDGICFTDLNGKIIDVNESFIKLMGFKGREDIIGINGLSLLKGESRERGERNMEKLAKRGSIGISEYPILTRDGRSIIIENRTSLISDEAGNPTGFVTFTRNIEDRKWTRDNLARVENILTAIGKMIERYPDGGDIDEWINVYLSLLGESVEVSTVSMFRTASDGDGSTAALDFLFGWADSGADPRMPQDTDTVLSVRSEELAKWIEDLSKGGFRTADLEDLTDEIMDDLRLDGMGALLVIPIMTGDTLWGTIEFINRRELREWFPSEIDALMTVSVIIGSKIRDHN